MTHLGNAITRAFLNNPKRNPWNVAKQIRMSPSTIYKLQSGSMTHIHPKHLVRIVNAITPNEIERAEIIAAHMKDESCGYAPGLIEVTVKTGNKVGRNKNP